MRTRMLLFGGLLAAVPVIVQTQSTPPPQSAQTAPKPAQSPANPPAAKPAFPAEAKIGYISLDAIFGDSAVGKRGLDQMSALNDRLNADLAARQKELQALSDKIKAQQAQPLVKAQTLAEWSKELQRKQREAQFAQQEAEVQMNQIKQDLLDQFQAQVQPIVEAIRIEKGLWMILSIEDGSAGLSIAAANPGLDLSGEVVKRLNAL